MEMPNKSQGGGKGITQKPPAPQRDSLQMPVILYYGGCGAKPPDEGLWGVSFRCDTSGWSVALISLWEGWIGKDI